HRRGTPPAGSPRPRPAKEADDGWLLLFDGETTSGWKVEGEARVWQMAPPDRATNSCPAWSRPLRSGRLGRGRGRPGWCRPSLPRCCAAAIATSRRATPFSYLTHNMSAICYYFHQSV